MSAATFCLASLWRLVARCAPVGDAHADGSASSSSSALSSASACSICFSSRACFLAEFFDGAAAAGLAFGLASALLLALGAYSRARRRSR
jgi:hypothetical protein